MGWFSSSSTPSTSKASDGGSIAPDRSSRRQCYIARDVFFDCLDANSIIDPVQDDKTARAKCPKEIVEFESACSKTWVNYFKEKRFMEYKRDQTIAKIKADDATAAAESRAGKS
ncbi:hypothetical protein PAAG_07921 [Paracoccidioides lutzii Pb01]|uniref:Cytochrome c oxidase assembly factor 6 n=1 Tax=Paracoccidioides lutzii (strain ATCC MYA-826 / Pb01) TaxID=502779 RepID=C1HAU2_PARBA|nr:hypothetical protein PAAG_07921 [Paracoccidioides lutzii Pb01]EEH37503.1 hypothetical protein PAAG_07921 [Paracoccidioides lutzii Pb01]